jgi:hypothetical protein
MNAIDYTAPELVVFTTIKQHPPQPPGDPPPPKPAPWWAGLTLDQQDELLNRIDPQLYGPGQYPPMAVRKWNREKRRVRMRQRWIEEIAALRKPCRCRTCRRAKRPPFPPYYVVRGISYECWLEAHAVDPELEEVLKPLRGQRERAGPAFVGHSEW